VFPITYLNGMTIFSTVTANLLTGVVLVEVLAVMAWRKTILPVTIGFNVPMLSTKTTHKLGICSIDPQLRFTR